MFAWRYFYETCICLLVSWFCFSYTHTWSLGGTLINLSRTQKLHCRLYHYHFVSRISQNKNIVRILKLDHCDIKMYLFVFECDVILFWFRFYIHTFEFTIWNNTAAPHRVPNCYFWPTPSGISVIRVLVIFIFL